MRSTQVGTTASLKRPGAFFAKRLRTASFLTAQWQVHQNLQAAPTTCWACLQPEIFGEENAYDHTCGLGTLRLCSIDRAFEMEGTKAMSELLRRHTSTFETEKHTKVLRCSLLPRTLSIYST